MGTIRILSAADVKALFTLPMAIEAVEKAYLQKHTGQGGVWPLVFHEFDPGRADLDIKSGNLDAEGIFGLKLVSWFGANPDKGLPALYGTSLICDLATGQPKALLNAGPVTDLRTGAAGAIGAKYLARKDSKNLLMVGCGELSPYLIAATLLALPQLQQVTVVNPRHPEKAAQKLPAIEAKVNSLLSAAQCDHSYCMAAAEDTEQAVRQADVILTATQSRGALIRREWLKPGTHISCVGADMSGKQEIDETILAEARVFGDDAAQCFSVGECEAAVRAGLLSALDGELGAVIAGDVPGRTDEGQITVFDSTGIALQDLVSAAVILHKAEKENRGTVTEL
ncbi:MAG: ornithine cyclodeaminase family protein [Oscillospiraceae bacterium]|nr:ornithine cyclodeaminase family protein [Oscillospiraceae bacterium]